MVVHFIFVKTGFDTIHIFQHELELVQIHGDFEVIGYRVIMNYVVKVRILYKIGLSVRLHLITNFLCQLSLTDKSICIMKKK